MGAENFAPTGIRPPDRPAGSESLYGQVKEAATNFIFIFCGATAQFAGRPPHFCGLYITHNKTHKQASARAHARTHTHTQFDEYKLSRAPLNEWSARRRGRYLYNTQQTQETNIHTRSGIRSRNSSKEGQQTYVLDRTATAGLNIV